MKMYRHNRAASYSAERGEPANYSAPFTSINNRYDNHRRPLAVPAAAAARVNAVYFHRARIAVNYRPKLLIKR